MRERGALSRKVAMHYGPSWRPECFAKYLKKQWLENQTAEIKEVARAFCSKGQLEEIARGPTPRPTAQPSKGPPLLISRRPGIAVPNLAVPSAQAQRLVLGPPPRRLGLAPLMCSIRNDTVEVGGGLDGGRAAASLLIPSSLSSRGTGAPGRIRNTSLERNSKLCSQGPTGGSCRQRPCVPWLETRRRSR